MGTCLAALFCLLLQAKGIDELLRGWSSENAEVRDQATREVLSRWKEWSEDDLSKLKRAAADPDSEVAGRAAATLDRIEVRRTLAGGALEAMHGIEDVVCRGSREDRLKLLKVAGERWAFQPLRDEDLAPLVRWAEKRRWNLTAEELQAVAQENHPHGDWSPVRPYHPLVRPFLDSEVPRTQIWALDFLAGCRTPEYAPAIAPLLKHPKAEVRAAAVRALGSVGGAETPRQIGPLLSDESAEVRRRTVQALAWRRCRDRIPEMADRLADPDQSVRAEAAEALGEFRAKEYADRIAALLADQKSGIAFSAAVKTLGILGALRHAGTIAPLLKTKDWFWKLEAAQALGRMGARDYAPDLVLLLTDSDLRVKWEAAEALGRLGAQDQVEAIAALLKDARFSNRAVAARTLGMLGAREKRQDILPLLSEPPWPVRNDAVTALARLGPAETRTDFLRILEDPKANVRSPLALAIAVLGTDGLSADERTRWIEALGRLRLAKDPTEQRAAAVALLCFKPQDPALQRDVLDQLAAFPRSEDSRTAVTVLHRISEQTGLERLRGARILARPIDSWTDLEAFLKDADLRLDAKEPLPFCGRVSDGVRASPLHVLAWLFSEEDVVPVVEGDRLRLLSGRDAAAFWRNRLKP